MATTIFNDDIITSTDLKMHLKHWFERAYISPISVKSGAIKLVLINREQAKHMSLLNYYAEMIIKFCQELHSQQTNKSDVFPWVKHLDKEEIVEFREELLATFTDAAHSGNWLALEEMLNAWIATAEAKTNPEIMELINPTGRPREYVRLK
jgi:hypothetical protein